jgi:hypothetical protein
MKLILIGTSAAVVAAFVFVELPSTAPAEPPPQQTRATDTPGAREVVATTGETTSIRVRGATLRVGDTADEVINTLRPADLKGFDFTSDPSQPDGLLVTRHYNVDGQSFSLTMGRRLPLGPDRIVRISTTRPQDGEKQSSRVASSPSSVKRIGRTDARHGNLN